MKAEELLKMLAHSFRTAKVSQASQHRHPFNPKFPVTSFQSSILFMKRLLRIPNRTAPLRISVFGFRIFDATGLSATGWLARLGAL